MNDLAHDEGGWQAYFRNRIFGEPYKIHQSNELFVWDNISERWKLVIGNEELSKHAPLSTSDMQQWVEDKVSNGIVPTRGEFIFWDEKIGEYREATYVERRDLLYYKLFNDPNTGAFLEI